MLQITPGRQLLYLHRAQGCSAGSSAVLAVPRQKNSVLSGGPLTTAGTRRCETSSVTLPSAPLLCWGGRGVTLRVTRHLSTYLSFCTVIQTKRSPYCLQRNIRLELGQIFRKTQLSHKHYLPFGKCYPWLQALGNGLCTSTVITLTSASCKGLLSGVGPAAVLCSAWRQKEVGARGVPTA